MSSSDPAEDPKFICQWCDKPYDNDSGLIKIEVHPRNVLEEPKH
jgi:hypothetical protein